MGTKPVYGSVHFSHISMSRICKGWAGILRDICRYKQTLYRLRLPLHGTQEFRYIYHIIPFCSPHTYPAHALLWIRLQEEERVLRNVLCMLIDLQIKFKVNNSLSVASSSLLDVKCKRGESSTRIGRLAYSLQIPTWIFYEFQIAVYKQYLHCSLFMNLPLTTSVH